MIIEITLCTEYNDSITCTCYIRYTSTRHTQNMLPGNVKIGALRLGQSYLAFVNYMRLTGKRTQLEGRDGNFGERCKRAALCYPLSIPTAGPSRLPWPLELLYLLERVDYGRKNGRKGRPENRVM